jgi:outer membrane lipopolysaccharide assembly protein LptE/RlpB
MSRGIFSNDLLANFTSRRLIVAGLCGYLSLLCGCAGYQLGNQSLYPPEIRTVYVPMFQSNSFRRNLGERLTEAVVKEIENRTPYKVVSDPNADSVLTGRLVSETKRVLVPSLTGDAREVQVGMQVQVTWVDRKGRLLRDTQNIPLPEEIADISSTGNVVPEVGQSIATAQQQAICRMAEQIVGLMEKPW